ncbi:hypothetical protein LAWI1_G003171, partial [Lachnellula willkommii]
PTSGVGQFVLSELIRRKAEFERIAGIVHTTRKVSPLKTFATEGVELVKGSPTDPTVYQSFDVVIAIPSNYVIRNQPAQIDAVLEAGVRHWYLSEFGTDLTVPGN